MSADSHSSALLVRPSEEEEEEEEEGGRKEGLFSVFGRNGRITGRCGRADGPVEGAGGRSLGK